MAPRSTGTRFLGTCRDALVMNPAYLYIPAAKPSRLRIRPAYLLLGCRPAPSSKRFGLYEDDPRQPAAPNHCGARGYNKHRNIPADHHPSVDHRSGDRCIETAASSVLRFNVFTARPWCYEPIGYSISQPCVLKTWGHPDRRCRSRSPCTPGLNQRSAFRSPPAAVG